MKRILLALGVVITLSSSAIAQNIQCPNRPAGDSSNACANTRFVGTASSISGTSPILVSPSKVISFDPNIATWSAGSFHLGAPDAAAPATQTLSVQNVVAGVSNAHGVNFTIAGSQSTGIGRGGDIVFNYARLGSSGSAQNSLARLVVIGGQEGNPGLRVYPNANINTMNHVFFSQGVGVNGEGTVIGSLAVNGTTASPTAITNNQELTSYSSYGWDGNGVGGTGNPTAIVFAAIQNWTPTKNGQGILFQAMPFDSTAAANEVSIVEGITVLGPSEFTQRGKGQGTIWAKGGYYLINALSLPTAPVATTFCTSPSIPANNGTAAFTINVGTSCGSSIGTITLPAATTGWVCDFHNVTAPATNIVEMTGGTTTTVTLTNYVRTTGVAGNWTDSNIIRAKCTAY